MRNQFFKLFIALLFITISLKGIGQTMQECTGSLGDPVVNEDFGVNTPSNMSSATNLILVNTCPNDNQYNLVKRTPDGCNENNWHRVEKDHTSQITGVSGYMMLINSSDEPKVIFSQTVKNLCPGTKYRFSAFFLNLMRLSAGGNKPNLIFTIKTAIGEESKPTGEINGTVTPQWFETDPLFFETGNESEIILEIKNIAPGGYGNDFYIDDITFRACGPEIDMKFPTLQDESMQSMCVGDTKTFTLNGDPQDADYKNYQWQVNKNTGNGWEDIAAATNPSAVTKTLTVTIANAIEGKYEYRIGVARNGFVTGACRVYSKSLTVNVEALPVAAGLAANYTVCEGSTLSLATLTGGAKYRISGPGKPMTEQTGPITINNIGLLNAGEYTVRAVSAIGCVGPAVKFNVAVKKNFTTAIDIAAFTLCKGETVKLTASQVGGDVNDTFTYTWTPAQGLDNTNQPVVNASPVQTTTYTVTISNGVCTSSKDITVTVNTPPEIKNHIGPFPQTIGFSICEGDFLTAQLNAVAPAGYRNYQWQVLNGTTWADLPGATNEQLNIPTTNLAVNTYQYRVTAWEDGNVGSAYCRAYAAESVKIFVNPVPVINPIADVTLCAGETLNLTASGAPLYEWTGADLAAPRAGNPLVVAGLSPGEHFFNVRGFTGGVNNCPSRDFVTVKVTVKPPILPTIATPAALCEGNTATLKVSTNLTVGNTYQWRPSTGLNFPDRATVEASPTQTTKYTVTVTNGLCIEEKEVTVTVINKPAITATKERYVFEGDAITLDAAVTGGYTSFSWSPRAGLSDPQSLTPTASPVNDTEYRLTVTNADCSFDVTESIFVHVFKKITIPNTFTPNGDGINDVWNIKELLAFPKSVTTIFNRYGQQLYQSIGYGKPWDGRYNGNAMPPGTYYYVIDLKNNTPKRTGYVTILK